MEKITLKKLSENILGWEYIEVLSTQLFREVNCDQLPYGCEKRTGKVYEYNYLCKVTHEDGTATLDFICEDDFVAILAHYEVISK